MTAKTATPTTATDKGKGKGKTAPPAPALALVPTTAVVDGVVATETSLRPEHIVRCEQVGLTFKNTANAVRDMWLAAGDLLNDMNVAYNNATWVREHVATAIGRVYDGGVFPAELTTAARAAFLYPKDSEARALLVGKNATWNMVRGDSVAAPIQAALESGDKKAAAAFKKLNAAIAKRQTAPTNAEHIVMARNAGFDIPETAKERKDRERKEGAANGGGGRQTSGAAGPETSPAPAAGAPANVPAQPALPLTEENGNALVVGLGKLTDLELCIRARAALTHRIAVLIGEGAKLDAGMSSTLLADQREGTSILMG